MSRSLALLSVLVSLLRITEGQTFHWGQCPEPPTQENFTLSQYVGKWYEIEKLPMIFKKGNCIQTNYSLEKNGKIKVLKKELLSDGRINQVEGNAVQTDEDPAKLRVNFSFFMPCAPHSILSTDYASYSVVYSCKSFLKLFHANFAWILSRTPQLNPEVVEQLKNLLRSYNIDTKKMMPTNQMNCPPKM
uniref:Apolipoprotein D n=1 Tax=Pelusios castaneus TaxID=367368 RepID=A0A8C8VKC4_9SAUR